MSISSSGHGVALVTGATVGIGYELARLLAEQRNDLIIASRDQEKMKQVADELGAEFGVTVWTIAVDLADPEAPEELRRRASETGRRVDILINNSGFGTFGKFWDVDAESSIDLLQVNMGALTHLTRLLLPAMIERGEGRIMNVASTAAFQPGPLMATYYASKAYVLHFSEAIAEELEGTGVTVTALCPGVTKTEFHERAGMEASGLVAGRGLMTAREVAEAGLRGMQRGKRIVIPGFANKFLAFSTRFAPRRFLTKFVYRLQEER